jgi:diguanylate cyclase (GGDEF)-like protein
VLIMDVDAFKSVNDRFGHGVGDRVLSGVAQAISSSMRSSDLVYRYGGDEFVAIARNCPVSSEPELIHRVSMINRSLEGRFAEVPSLTLSAGIAFGPGGADGEELLSHADKALYRAKRTPVKCCVYDPEVDK